VAVLISLQVEHQQEKDQQVKKPFHFLLQQSAAFPFHFNLALFEYLQHSLPLYPFHLQQLEHLQLLRQLNSNHCFDYFLKFPLLVLRFL